MSIRAKMKVLGIVAAALVAPLMATPAHAVFDGTAKNFMGLDWYVLNDYGVTETEVSGGELSYRNTTAGNGAAIWLNQSSNDNLGSGISAANKAFFEDMRTSSYSANDTTPWVRWSLRMRYDIGTSQNDLTVNGPGGTATSVASGTLPYEPAAFGGDRLSIGRDFGFAYFTAHKGTATAPGGVFNGVDNFTGTSTYALTSGYPGTHPADWVRTPGTGGNYDVANEDIVTITMGKRPDGTLDIYWEGPEILNGPAHYISTLGTENPDWFFYQIEIRGRGGAGTPVNTAQELLLFEWGNDWDSSGLGPQSEIPEPASLALLGLGGLLALGRRRRA